MFNKLIDFIQENAPNYQDRDLIENSIKKHIRYGTYDFEIDNKGEYIFACSWNVKGDTALITELIIAKKYKGIRTIKWIIARNWGKFPYVRKIEWDRELKYPERKRRQYLIKEVL